MAEDALQESIRAHWRSRETFSSGGGPNSRRSPFENLLINMLVEHGVHREAIHLGMSFKLPGGYQPTTRKWDLLVIEDELPVAAIEIWCMSGGAIGKNLRSRQDDILAAVADVNRAYRSSQAQAVKPLLGMFLVMEDTIDTARPYRRTIAGEIEEAPSIQDRMQEFLRRIAQDGLYDAICFVTTSAPPNFTVKEPAQALGFARFSRTVADRIERIRSADEDAVALGRMLAEREDIDDLLSGITSTPRGLSAAEASLIQRRRHLVAELQRLALDPASNETTMQAAIGKNYWLFGGQYIGMADRSIVAHDQYDIPLISADNSLHIVELKGPESKLVKDHRGSLIVANQVHEAASQCLNYLQALDETGASLQAQRLRDGRPAYDLGRSRATVIIGHPERAATTKVSRIRIEQAIRAYNAHLSRIQVLTYADLLDGAERALRFEEDGTT
ncbi:Shedu anti-phage system protein SduA domain-containing protein [Actinoplanes sp. TFC3]|uniref:Shedu anti-phage system protein SduA domain-containing protein n=1 Tax=Actinoplanes sp. TFC3 TaxID=1710355 RepID=UPI0009E71F45|nr:Shedu anti-phage system protein SduA domain-containing protein [Actinoplanes sp. TFC3]